MAKQLNVNLAFTADTSKVKAQLQDLQTRLSNLTAGKRIPGMELGITKDIQEGISAAAQLKVQLEQATNINTGKLDLTKFSQSLKDSNMSIDKYADSLKKLGPQGQEAFLQLTRSISSAEVPLLHVNERLNEMWVTLKNTARWQISSSILHGFMGAVQSAYGYAQDLNESLNNIRIVSGQSTEQMAKFADQANKAAKALSATTIDYTNAALIYYQQGLNEQEIEERAEVTLKMANVSRESAEVVSDQMTAVWNNFDDGSKSLEYYADVMTALGAKTASSTAEISDGLEKFAAVAETVGLSYEYATASLATITATTRQSADVVGTALKTLFARIQGLSLGETLEDGVNLNKYSEALAKVGISIFEQNGELKAMDDILEEMGSKWETLDKSQQTALAQTVAGVRQYTQLIALMDNWDFMQENLETAKNSEGALQEQADIYAESWEAASDRVQAAMEALYQDILDDEFFIDVLNGVEKVLTGVDDLIDGLGGIKPILTIISALFLKTFSGKIVSSIKSVKDGVISIANPEKAKQKAIATRQESIDAGTKLFNDISPDSKWGEVKRQGLTQEYAIQQSLLDNAGKITLEKQKEYQIRLDSLNLMQSELEVSAKKLDKDKASYAEQKRRQLLMSRPGNSNEYSQKATKAYLLKNEQMGQITAFANQVKAGKNIKNAEDQIEAFEKIKARIQNAKTVDGDALNLGIDFNQIKNFDQLEEKLEAVYDKLFIDVSQIENIPSSIESVGKAAHDTAKEMVELNVQGENIGNVAEELQNDINGNAEALTDWRTGIVDIAGNVAMLTGSLTALGSAWNELETSIQEGDISGAVGSLVAMASVLPMVSGGISALLGTLKTVAPTMVATNAATGALSLSLKGLSLSVPWLTAIAAVLTILLPKILELIPTAKKAREAIQEATQAYEEQKQVVDDLNDTLQTTKDRIEELNNQDTLTIIEQEELNKLKQESAYLERQLELEKQRQKLLQGNSARTINDNYKTNYASLSESVAVQEGAYSSYEELTQNAKERFDVGLLTKDEYNDELIEIRKDYEELISTWYSENKDMIKAAEDDYFQYISAVNSGVIDFNADDIKSKQDILSGIRKNMYLTDAEYENTVLNPILQNSVLDPTEDSLYQTIVSNNGATEGISLNKQIENELRLAGVSVEEFLNYISKNITDTRGKIESLEGFDINGDDGEKLKSLTADDWQILAELNFENIEDADELWKALDHYKNSKIEIEIDGLAQAQELLDILNQAEEPLEKALSSYKSNGYLTMDEVQELISANEEYAKYITKVGDAYVLTGQSLTDFQTLEAQEAAALDAKIGMLQESEQVNKEYVENYKRTWDDLIAKSDEWQNYNFGSEDQANLFKERTQDLSDIAEKYKNGTVTADEYFETIDNRLKGLGSGFSQLQGEVDNNIASTDLYEATMVAATGSIADGLSDLNKQFTSGKINMDEYYKGTIAGTKALMTAQAKTNKYIKANADETYELIESADTAVTSTDEYKEAVQQVSELNAWSEQVKDAEAMNSTVETLTNNYDYLINYADNFGGIDFTIDNNFDTTATQFQDLCSQMSTNITKLHDTNKEAYDNIIASMIEAGANLDKGVAYNSDQLNAAMIKDVNVAEAAINTSMAECGGNISSVSQAAGNVLSALGELISNFDYTLEFDPYIKPGKFNLYEWVTSKGKSGIELPNIGFNITGSGGESVNNFVNSLQEAGSYLSTQTSGFGQGGIFDYGQESEDWSPLDPSEIETDNLRDKGGKDKYTPEVERYHEITRAIENQERALDDLSNAKDEAFGASKISLMEQELAQMEALKAKQQQLLTDAEKYLASDKADLMSAYPGAKIDANTGEILNFEELQRNTTSEEQNEILEQYESTIDKINETKDAIEESKRQIKSLNYEKLSYNLELKLDINDAELQKLEYFLNKYSDDFYKMAESIALMTDKIEPVKNNLEDYRAQDEALSQAYEKGKISQEAYIKGLKEVREGYYENLETLNELNKEMLEYYENTLSAAKDELNDYTDHMEHLTGVLDHYLNLMDILGKQKDYDAIGNFLNGKASITRDRLDVAKDYYQILLEQKETVKAELNAAIESGDEALIKLHQKEWDAIVDATDEAQEEVLSLTEEWAQSMQEIIKNNMTKIADELEKSLTNGFGFDFLLDQWDRINTQQEEYLDKTNQIYETNKMMRTAQKALDETTNKVAKQKLKNFIEETARLQENTKLSKHELEIRQAQYDLLLAEIALEEAQNAKSTVRLSRDSEGNFGYIYTADEDKVNEAEQNLDDKRNNIYNLSLEGQKEYMDKYLQASKEMYDELNELQAQYLEGLLTEEEFKLRSEAIKKYYLGSSEFQKAMADLEEEYRKGNLGSEEEYNRLRQEIIRKYSAQDIGILNQYLDIANTSNRIAREEDAKLQQKYQDENIISQEEYYKKKAEMIKSFNENMATLDKAYYEDGALTEAEYNQLRENLTNKFHNDMKELNKTYYQDGIENENKFNQEKEALTNKYHADIKALNDAFYIDGTISEEEYNNERNALTKKYHDDINALTKDYYKTGLEDDKNYNKEKAELIDTFANDSKGVLGDFFDFYLDKTESTGDNASESWGDNLGNMTHNTSDWSDDVNDYLDEVEEGAEDMRDVYEEVNEDLEDALENSAEATEDLKDESDDLRKEIKNKVIPAIKDEIDEVKKLTTKYGLQKDELDKLIDTYEDYLDLIGEKIEYHSIETEEPEIQIPKEEQTETPSAEEKPVNNSEAKKIAKEAQEIINKVHYGKDGMTEGNNGWAPNARKKGYSEEAIAIAKKAFNDSKDGSGYSYFYEEALKLAGQYNTGGYTGAWGPEGKLAFLHEKELILNKDDTENILNTVSFIRDIVSMIDNKANMSSLFSMSAMAGITSGNMGMEQQVTIYAEFPDATDHNEIEQAFNSLLNTASQYANRK